MVQILFAQAVPGTPASWLLLLVLGGALMVGVTLATVLLGNRHTQGVTKALLIAGAVFLGLVGLWLASGTAVRHTADQQAMATHYLTLADNMEQSHEAGPTLAAEYRQKAAELLQPSTSYRSSTTRSGSFGVAFLSPLLLIPFLVILFLLFKHHGLGAGMAALAIPFALLFFSYGSFQSQSNSHTAPNSTASYADEAAFMDSVRQHTEPVQNVSISADDVGETDVIETEAMHALRAAVVDDTPSEDPIAGPPPKSAEAMPDWVRQPPKSVENVYRRVVESSWFHRSEVEARIGLAVQAEVQQYLQELANEEGRGRVTAPSLDKLGVTPRYIREHIIADEYYETRNFENLEDSSGVVNLHQLLEFDASVTDDLRTRWRYFAREENVRVVAVMMGGILATLAGALGLIKLDTYTKGYYTKRLFIGVPAAIIGTGLLLTLFA